MRRLRFGRPMRLLSAADFERVFQHAERSSSKSLTVLARPSGRLRARLGLAVPRRQIRKAVERNRVKRLIRESFRQHQALLEGLDVVVVVRGPLAEKSTERVFRCLDNHWQQLGRRGRAEPQ